MLGVLLQTLVLSVLCFAGVAGGCFWLVHHYLGPDSAISWLAGALGSVLALISVLWLFLPVAVVIASLFMEPVCRAVERRWYPDLPPAPGSSWSAQLLEGLGIALRVTLLSVISLIISLVVPGLGHVLGWVITAWALGRGLFATVALRRMDRRTARQAYRAHRWDVLIQGGLLTIAGTLPFVNFLLPVLGPAAMVHVMMVSHSGVRRRVESWG
jgi:uncharacterized protein involved in cysteine biosynthesis